jgi:hypothetical protein
MGGLGIDRGNGPEGGVEGGRADRRRAFDLENKPGPFERNNRLFNRQVTTVIL